MSCSMSMSMSMHDIFFEKVLQTNPTTSSCFFCLQDCPKNNDNFSFRNVSRFLDLFHAAQSNDFKRKLQQFSNSSESCSVVSTCEDCSQITEEFTVLYNLLEVTKLRVSWCIQKMNKVMAIAERKSKLRPLGTSILMARINCSSEGRLRNAAMGLLKASTPFPLVALSRVPKLPGEEGMPTPSVKMEPPEPNLSDNHYQRSPSPPKRKRKKPSWASTFETEWMDLRNCPDEDSDSSPESSLPLSSRMLQRIVGKMKKVSKNATELNRPGPGPDSDDYSLPKRKKRTSFAFPRKAEPMDSVEDSPPESAIPLSSRIKGNINGKMLKNENVTESNASDSDDYILPQSPASSSSSLPSLEEEEIKFVRLTAKPKKRKRKPYRKGKPKIKKTNQTSKCTYCRARFAQSSRLDLHLFQYHCDHFFPNSKFESVTQEQYLKILTELLFQDLIEGKTNCSFCDKAFFEEKDVRQVARYKKHLVNDHFPELQGKLIGIQNDPNLSDILEKVNPHGRVCGCGVYISSRYNQAMHDKLHCTLTKRLEVNSLWSSNVKMNVEEVISCTYCRGKFKGPQPLKFHMIQHHCEKMFPRHKLDSVSDLQFQRILMDLLFKEAMESGSCSYCDNVQWKAHGYKYHMVTQHYAELEKKLEEIQSDSDLEATLSKANPHGRVCECGAYVPSVYHQTNHDNLYCPRGETKVRQRHEIKDDGFMMMFDVCSDPIPPSKFKNKATTLVTCKLCNKVMQHRAAFDHWTYFCPKGKRLKKEKPKDTKRTMYGFSRECPYCRFDCKRPEFSNVVRRHMIRFHPEHFFNKEEIEVTMSMDVFKRVLVDIIFPECLQKVGPSVSCRLCEANFLSVYVTKVHLVQNHKEELMNRLKALEGKQDLEKRLKECNPHGVTCPCGVYLPKGTADSRKKQMGFHEKFLCKLKIGVENEASENINEQINDDDEFEH